MGRSIKGLRRVQSGQTEGEVLDWTVRSERTGGGVDRTGGWWRVLPYWVVLHCTVLCRAVLRGTALPFRSGALHSGSGIAVGQALEMSARSCSLQ